MWGAYGLHRGIYLYGNQSGGFTDVTVTMVNIFTIGGCAGMRSAATGGRGGIAIDGFCWQRKCYLCYLTCADKRGKGYSVLSDLCWQRREVVFSIIWLVLTKEGGGIQYYLTCADKRGKVYSVLSDLCWQRREGVFSIMWLVLTK